MTTDILTTPQVVNGTTFTHQGAHIISKNRVKPGSYIESKMKANKTFMSSTFWLINYANESTAACQKRTTELDIQECIGYPTTKIQTQQMGSNSHSRNVPAACNQILSRSVGNNVALTDKAYDCSIFNASPGYGLVQLHGANNILFENLYALGGITLRLETGAGGLYAGVFDVKAKNISCENGIAAVMLGPHTTKNGTVKIDGVSAKSCLFAVKVGSGFIDRKHKTDTNAQLGTFANDSEIKNIHAVFGLNAQIDEKAIYQLEPEYYKDIHMSQMPHANFLEAPSVGAAINGTKGYYKVAFSNISTEGFKYHKDKLVTDVDFASREKDKWNIVKTIPACAEMSKDKNKKETKTRKKKK